MDALDAVVHVNTLSVTPHFSFTRETDYILGYFFYVAFAATGPPTAEVSSIWMPLSVVVIMHMTHVCAHLQSSSQAME